jgi:hypothetical protein
MAMTQVADVMSRGVRTMSPSDAMRGDVATAAGTADVAETLACISERA